MMANTAPPQQPQAGPPPPAPTTICWSAYTAALIATAIFVPMIALIANIAFYLMKTNIYFAGAHIIGVIVKHPLPDVSNPVRNSVNILLALLVGLIGWLLFALWYQRFTTVCTANPSTYDELRHIFDDIAARIPANPPYAVALTPVGIAYRQATIHANAIVRTLAGRRGGVSWVCASGYINLWKQIHRLQEALIVFDQKETVIAEARQDEWRLKGSAIGDVDEVLATLRYALAGLGVPPVAGMIAPSPPPSSQEARALLSKVRSVINEYRDTRREGLARARNRLMTTGLVTGLITNVLLALVILALPDTDAQQKRIVTAGILFFVGAIIGLFNRLYLDGQSDSAIEDFGLSTARLVTTPLLSGLAGVGGVLISVLMPSVLQGVLPVPERLPPAVATVNAVNASFATVIAATLQPTSLSTATVTTATATPAVVRQSPSPTETSIPQATSTPTGTSATASPTVTATASATAAPNLGVVKTADLKEVFDVETYPFEVVLAAIFALTPGLLINRLQRQTEKLKADLASTQASQQSSGGGR